MPPEQSFQLEQIHADISELRAETMRLNAEAIKPVSILELCLVVVVASLLTSAGIVLGLALSVVLQLH